MMKFSSNRFILLLLFLFCNSLLANDSVSIRENFADVSFSLNNPTIFVSEGTLIYNSKENPKNTPSTKAVQKIKNTRKKEVSTERGAVSHRSRKLQQLYYYTIDDKKKIKRYYITSKNFVTGSNIKSFIFQDKSSYNVAALFLKNSVQVKPELFLHIYKTTFYPVRPPPLII